MTSKIGTSSWFDLPVPDLVDAMAFYEALLGWTYVKLQEEKHYQYIMIQVGDQLIGGLRQIDQTQSLQNVVGPIIYFTVDELTPKMDRIKELGGKMVGEQVGLGKGRGSYQWFRDRANNLVALWAPK